LVLLTVGAAVLAVAAARIVAMTLMTKPQADWGPQALGPLTARNRIPMFEQVALPQDTRLGLVSHHLQLHWRPMIVAELVVNDYKRGKHRAVPEP
jgi:hypothetical protein